ncbi:MAG TPA: hypothetical protein VGO67_22695 [Verrucomicrobiae bacterium]|jgi:hypothetical protein
MNFVWIIAFLIVGAGVGNARSEDGVILNDSKWSVLDRIESVRRSYINVNIAIGTNTPAFDEYAFNLMINGAERLRSSWELKSVPPLSVKNITFDAIAMKYGVKGEISTEDGRFNWQFADNALWIFDDKEYTPRSFEFKKDELQRLKKIASKITAKQAEDLARHYLHAIGLTEQGLQLLEPPRVSSYGFADSDGTEHHLPIFDIKWSMPGYDDPAPGVRFDISGITGGVAHYANTSTKLPKAPLPTNYLDMLEILPPTNSAQRLGLKPWPHK